MSDQFDLFPETLLVTLDRGRVYTTSLKVAEYFGKQHKNVIRAIETLRAEIDLVTGGQPNFGPASSFGRLNFEPSSYVNQQSKRQPMYLLSHDGFALLVMGFTGKEALAWKVKFLAAFRYMESIVADRTKRAESALFQLKPHWRVIRDFNELSRERLIRKTGHRSPNTITANRRRMRQVGLIR